MNVRLGDFQELRRYTNYKSSGTTEDNSIDFSPEFLNIDPHNGNCNGVKYVINNLLERVIKVTSVNLLNSVTKLLVRRIINSDATLPFSIRRRQFPIRPAFAMTANKSQGQTIATVGIYLGRDFLSHGQLYVALSRCGSRGKIRILSRVESKQGYQGKVMQNCVFTEVLSHLQDN